MKQNVRTLKSEIVQRENIADSLKRQIRELRRTTKFQSSSKQKDLSMYTPDSPLIPANFSSREQEGSDSGYNEPFYSAQKASNNNSYVQRQRKSRTPVRAQNRSAY